MRFLVLILLLIPSKVLMATVPVKPIKTIPEHQLDCLVKNAFYEAMTEGKTGRQQVTKVVFNRTKDHNFCKTIYSSHQFSWTLRKQKPIPKHLIAMLKKEVLSVYYGFDTVPFPDATHYHTTKVKPVWRLQLAKLGVYRAHVFYC